MESLIDSVIDFLRVRQLNFMVAGIVTAAYLIYQYWDVLTKNQQDDEDCRHVRQSRSRSKSAARSRSRSRSANNYKLTDSRHRRRNHRRCPDCSLCDFQK